MAAAGRREEFTAQHETRLRRLTEHAAMLGKLVLLLPTPHVGFHYSQSLRDASRACLQALARLPMVFSHMRESRQMPAPFVWNQTLRLRDVPEGPATHLLLRWERWTGQIVEAREEIKLLMKRQRVTLDSEASDESVIGQGVVICDMERAMVEEVGTLVRLVRSMFRKIKVRCISRLSDHAPPARIALIDRFYRLGASVTVLLDDLISHLMSPQCAMTIATVATTLIATGEELLDVAVELCQMTTGEGGKWIDLLHRDLQVSLSNIHERNPQR